ncbi:MAG: ACT domain-containing protein [Actinomycetota bacterium]
MLEEIIVLSDDDRPGMLAAIGELLGGAGVNIETIAASNRIGQGVIHLVVDDGDDAAEILRSNDYKVEASRPVMAATLDDKPGEFGRFCRKLSNAGVDISACYVARRSGGETELIFAVDDLDAAKNA